MNKFKRIAVLVSVFCVLPIFAEERRINLRQAMLDIERQYNVHFVYNAALLVEDRIIVQMPDSWSLKKKLDFMFAGTGIVWQSEQEYIMLIKTETVAKYVLSGYVYTPEGETLMNVTVHDLSGDAVTVTNAQGFYSLSLTHSPVRVQFSFVGFQPQTVSLDLNSDRRMDIVLQDGKILDEVTVLEDRNAQINTTQTGKISLNQDDLSNGAILLSSPDLVKTLQRFSGVHPGVELSSGFYVHGGNGDENLFLLDGTPVYQGGHLGGLFSAFNTDVIKQADFYKSGFPARYGGRLSSVTDLRTKDGDMQHYRGTFSIGLLEGRFVLGGPLIKGRTSFNFGMRRSWADVFTAPFFGLYNLAHRDEPLNGRYAFEDVHAKVTHRFTERSKADVSFYMGHDLLKYNDRICIQDPYGTGHLNHFEVNERNFKMRWGNINTAINWDYIFSPELYGRFTLFYARNKSMYHFRSEENETREYKQIDYQYIQELNDSYIDETGYRMEFDYRPNNVHHVRFGSNYSYHCFRPQNTSDYSVRLGEGELLDTLAAQGKYQDQVHDFSLYAEDEIDLLRNFRMNVGLHYTVFGKETHFRQALEPRLAFLYRVHDKHSFKVSYTHMSQFVHQLSNSYLNLPLDFWIPATERIKPMVSRQIAVGFYGIWGRNVNYSCEGYYKTMAHLLDYRGGIGIVPSVSKWDERVSEGNGRAYGLDFSLNYHKKDFSVDGQYTLSWSKRQFDDYGPVWFYDRFDHRHLLQLHGLYRFKNMELYVAWIYRSGDRMTLPTQRVNCPWLPDVDLPQLGPEEIQVAEYPNNIKLPDYHRMDIGLNFNHTTKRGFQRIWNVSFYNVYCRLNPLFTEIVQQKDGSYKGHSKGYIPIIPSFSYTLKF